MSKWVTLERDLICYIQQLSIRKEPLFAENKSQKYTRRGFVNVSTYIKTLDTKCEEMLKETNDPALQPLSKIMIKYLNQQ